LLQGLEHLFFCVSRDNVKNLHASFKDKN
jgi:hypothetical protein